MTLAPLSHIAGCHRAKDCPACAEVVKVLRQMEELACTCPAGARRGGLFSHLTGCPAEPVDTLRIRLAGYGAKVPD